jgi:hypothetical protein
MFNTEGDYTYFFTTLSAPYQIPPMGAAYDICRAAHLYVIYYNPSLSPYPVYQLNNSF